MLLAAPALAEPPQKAGSFDQFLSSAMGDFKVSLQKKNQSEYGKSSGFRPIEAIQIQLSRNENLQHRRSISEYTQGLAPRNLFVEDRGIAVRVQPRGPTQLKLLSSLSDGQNKIEALSTQKAITKSLLERYLAASHYASAFEVSRLWATIVQKRHQRFSMVQAAARSSEAKATDLIKDRSALEDAEMNQGLADSELKVAAARLKLFDPTVGEILPSRDELPTPIQMLKVVSETPSASAPLAAELAREKTERAKQSAAYEVAKDERIVQFVEVSYAETQENRLLRDDRQLGIKVAFNVPGFASSELSRSEKSRELVKYEVEAREAQREEAITQLTAKEALENAAALYKSITALESRPAEQRLRRLVNRQDPLLAISIDEDALRREMRKIEITKKAFESYFYYLASAGALANRAGTNFLSRDLKELSL